MKKSHALPVIVLICFFAPCSRAQSIPDIFSKALSNVRGFNFWASAPFYIAFPSSMHRDDSVPYPIRLAVSLKYGPINFGAKHADSSYSKTVVTDTVVEDSIGKCWYCEHHVDSIRYEGKKSEKVYHSRSVNRRVGKCSQLCPTSVVVMDTTIKQQYSHSMSLNFGYNHTSTLGIITDSAFKTAFPYGGFFISAVTPIISGDPLSMLLGVGGSIYSSSDVVGTLRDTMSTVKLTASETFSPEVFIGFGLDCGGGFNLFLDFAYQYLKFGGLNYAVTGGSKQLNEIYKALPHEMNLSAFHIKFGMSLDTKLGD